MSLAVIPALAVAVFIPVGYLVWISTRDFFETRKLNLILVCFLWGITAYLLAYIIHSNLIANRVLPQGSVVRFTAPVLEEILKGAILLYLIRRTDFTYFVDGAIYGFTLSCLVAVFGFLALLLRSRFGRALAGIRVNEQRMRATGFSTYPYKLAAFVISGGFAGLGDG